MSANETPAPPAPAAEPSDAALISRVRAGDATAYAQLCERHVGAARVLARHLATGTDAPDAALPDELVPDELVPDEVVADEVVAETVTRILAALRGGGGPQAGFRPYLLVSVRRTAGERARGSRRSSPAPEEFGPYDTAEPYVDPALRGLETNTMARAFLSLPERWRAVLWHTEIEGGRPAAVAPLLGLSANGAAALGYAAREGLRQAYLQLHLAESARRACRPAVDKLAAYIRGGLAERDCVQVERHLDGCQDCAAGYAELADIKTVLRTVVGPLVLGTAAAGYLADITAGRAMGMAAGGRGGRGAGGPREPRGPRRVWWLRSRRPWRRQRGQRWQRGWRRRRASRRAIGAGTTETRQ